MLRAQIISVILCAWSSLVLADAHRSTEASLSLLNISTSGPGSEANLLHREPLNSQFSFSVGGARVDRYQLVDLQGLAGVKFQNGQIWGVELTGGYNSQGRVLPKLLLSGEIHFNAGGGFSPTLSVREQDYNDTNVTMLSLGVDYEPAIPWIFILRTYLVHSYFKQASVDGWSSAFMVKLVHVGFEGKRLYGFFSYGGEGVLRGGSPTTETLNSWNAGVGADLSLFEDLIVKPSIDFQKYPQPGTEIVRGTMGLEIRW